MEKSVRRLKMPNNIDRFDKNIFHSHIICNKCGYVKDIFDKFNIELPIVKDYDIIDYDLSFNGICKNCRKEEK